MEASMLAFTGMVLSLAAGIFLPLFIDTKHDKGSLIALIPAIVAVMFAGMVIGTSMQRPTMLLGGRIVLDPLSVTLGLVTIFVAALVLLASSEFTRGKDTASSFYSISYMAILGSILVIFTSSISIFVASWILMSVASYVLAAIEKSKISADAALKYAIMGGASTVFLIMWIGTVPYLSGDVLLAGGNSFSVPLVATAAALMLVLAVGFKAGAFPFHAWLPDVYSNINGTIVALLTGIVKVAAVAGAVRMLIYTLVPPGAVETLVALLGILSVATMTYGNIAALSAKNIQRIMAYSSIAHVGYLLLGVTALSFALKTGGFAHGLVLFATAAIAVHLIAYAFSKPGVFLVTSLPGAQSLESLKGLYSSDRVLAFSLTVVVMSLLGMPPLAGFWGKLYLFQSIIPVSTALLVIAIVNSGISSFYYARIVRELYQEPEDGEAVIDVPPAIRVPVIIFAVASILLGLGIMTLLFNQLAIMMP